MELVQGRFQEDALGLILIDDQEKTRTPADVAYVVPDDPHQEVIARTAGFRTHTPLSVNLSASPAF
jgi:hypothetical protein